MPLTQTTDVQLTAPLPSIGQDLMNTPAEYTDYNGTLLQMAQVTTGAPLGTTEPPILPDLVGSQQPSNRIIPTENRFMRVDAQNCSIANISINGLLNATVCTTSYIYNWREYITYLPLLLQVRRSAMRVAMRVMRTMMVVMWMMMMIVMRTMMMVMRTMMVAMRMMMWMMMVMILMRTKRRRRRRMVMMVVVMWMMMIVTMAMMVVMRTMMVMRMMVMVMLAMKTMMCAMMVVMVMRAMMVVMRTLMQ